MSIDYTFGAAYGVGGIYTDANDLPGKLKGIDHFEPDTFPNLPDGVMLSFGGDQMSGPSRWMLCVTESSVRVDKYGMSWPSNEVELLTELTTSPEMRVKLVEAIKDLELDGTPGWLFTVDVS